MDFQPSSMTEVIELDGSNWQTKADLYEALLKALGAPEWHGRNLDALADSIRGGDLNQINPPIQITFFGSETMGREALDAARAFVGLCDELAEGGIAIDAALAIGGTS
jgi:RNAse (barnase) inhibitor barstar